MSVRICGTGSALPDKVLTNSDIEKIVDTSDEWIVERTGIRERRVAEPGMLPALAAKAAQNALESAGETADNVELIIVATCSAEMLLPCCACQVQSIIGAQKATAFDINAACSGFLFALQTVRCYIDSGVYQNALVIGAELLSGLVDWSDRSTCVLFGDGAGAVFLKKSGSAEGIVSMVQGSDGTGGMALRCGRADHIQMNGREIYRFATRQVPECILQALEQAEISAEDVDLFLLHQANRRIIETIARKMCLDMAKFPINLDRVGNMSSASIPVLLDELNKCGIIKQGQRIVLSGFGAGLTYGACVINW